MKTDLILQRSTFFSTNSSSTILNRLSTGSISLIRKTIFLVCIGLLSFNSWGQIAQTVILNPGITSWQSPVGATEITVKCWGGGGGGGRSTTSGQGGSGGGSGGYTTRTIALNGQTTFDVVVGNGGIRQAHNLSTAATAGGNTSFINTGLSINLIANGGGFGSQNSGAAGSGGSASGGSTNTAGTSGAVGGSSGGAGGNAPNGGSGGAAKQNGNGNAGAIPGGGGGGGERDNQDRRGGHGGDGRIEISYTLPESSFTSFRSIAAAGWSANSTWQMSADGTNWVTATFVPNSSTLNISILNDVTITDLTIPTTQTVTIGDAQLTVSGNLINNGIIASSDGNSTLEVQGNFSNSATGTIGVQNDLILQGNFTNTNSSLSLSCKVLIQGTSNQNIGSFSCSDNVEMEKTGGTATFIGNVTCSGDLILNGNGGTLDLGASLTHIFSGKIEFERGTLNGGSATLNANGDQQDAWTRNNSHTTSFVAGSGTVVFGRSGDQTINTTTAGLTTFNNVTFAGSGVKTIPAEITVNGNLTLTGTASTALAANETIGGNVTIGAGTTLERSTFSLTTLGNFVNNGTLLGSGAVNFTGGAATQTISGTGALNFSNVIINKSSGVVRLGNNISISGALDFQQGNLDLNGKTLNYSGGIGISTSNGGLIGNVAQSKLNLTTSSQITDGLFQNGEIYDLTIGDDAGVSSSGSYTILHSLTVGNGATFTKEDGSTIIFKGDVVNDGSIIDGTSGILGGSFTFNNTNEQTISGQPLSVTNLEVSKTLGKLIVSVPITITGKFDVNGIIDNSTNLITLGSSAGPGTLVHTAGRITGALRRYFANSTGTNYYFPVGNSSHTRGVTINMSQSPGSNDEYITAQYKAGTPVSVSGATLYDGLPLTTADGQLIQNYDEEGYWQIDPKQYNSGIDLANYTISLQMNNISGVNDYTKTRIIKADGPSHVAWSALTHVSATGSNENFTLTASGNGFSWFNGGGDNNNNPLPVELLSFNGTCNEGMINLLWQTASEFNSSHFDVEKSTDGETWRVLATIPSAGTSNELLTYQALDNNGTNGANYYRLRQVDIDGKEKLYDPINVSCVETTAGYFTSYPNPSGNEFQVVVNNKEILGACTLNIVDVHGKVIDQRSIDMKDGINMFVINETLNPGIYFLNITNGIKSTQVIKHAVK